MSSLKYHEYVWYLLCYCSLICVKRGHSKILYPSGFYKKKSSFIFENISNLVCHFQKSGHTNTLAQLYHTLVYSYQAASFGHLRVVQIMEPKQQQQKYNN